MESFVKHWNGLLKEVMQLPSTEVLKKQLDVGLSCQGGDQSKVRLDVRDLSQTK